MSGLISSLRALIASIWKGKRPKTEAERRREALKADLDKFADWYVRSGLDP